MLQLLCSFVGSLFAIREAENFESPLHPFGTLAVQLCSQGQQRSWTIHVLDDATSRKTLSSKKGHKNKATSTKICCIIHFTIMVMLVV